MHRCLYYWFHVLARILERNNDVSGHIMKCLLCYFLGFLILSFTKFWLWQILCQISQIVDDKYSSSKFWGFTSFYDSLEKFSIVMHVTSYVRLRAKLSRRCILTRLTNLMNLKYKLSLKTHWPEKHNFLSRFGWLIERRIGQMNGTYMCSNNLSNRSIERWIDRPTGCD